MAAPTTTRGKHCPLFHCRSVPSLTSVLHPAFPSIRGYTRADAASASWVRLDLDDGDNYARHVILYISFGVTDAVWQNFIYWVMGALSNDPAQLAHLVGFYKAIQSAGAAGVFRLDSNLTAYMTELAVTWALCAFAIVCIVPAIYLHVKDREYHLERGKGL